MKCAIAFLLTMLLQAASYPQTIEPEQVARQMVKAARSNPAGRMPSRAEIMLNTPTEQIDNALAQLTDAFRTALQLKTRTMWPFRFEETLDRHTMAELLFATGEFYSDGKLQPAAVTILATRVKSLPKEIINKWTKTIEKNLELRIDKVNMIWFMVQQPMFDGTTLDTRLADRQLKRLQTIPMYQVGRWGGYLGADKTAAALTLIKVDDLFQGDVFQKAVFESALPHAEEILKEFRK